MSEDKTEQGFNDSELLDIMQEIESLEREFASDDQAAGENLAIAAHEVKKTSLQDEIDQEMNATSNVEVDEDNYEELDEAVAEEAHSNVVTLSPKAQKATSTENAAPMSFSANGQMNLELQFALGNANATLHVNGDQGVTFEMDGVTLTLHPEEGCHVTMAHGVKFSVPLKTAEALKKAV